MILDTPWPDIIARGVLLAIAAIIWVVVLIRLNGLRSLSKMTNFDFVMTIAMGSLIASASQSEKILPFLQGLAAMVSLFAVQWTAARLRKSSDAVEAAIFYPNIFPFVTSSGGVRRFRPDGTQVPA